MQRWTYSAFVGAYVPGAAEIAWDRSGRIRGRFMKSWSGKGRKFDAIVALPRRCHHENLYTSESETTCQSGPISPRRWRNGRKIRNRWKWGRSSPSRVCNASQDTFMSQARLHKDERSEGTNALPKCHSWRIIVPYSDLIWNSSDFDFNIINIITWKKYYLLIK